MFYSRNKSVKYVYFLLIALKRYKNNLEFKKDKRRYK